MTALPLILGIHGGHDGSVAGLAGGELLFSYEAEKGSHARHAYLGIDTLLAAARALPEKPSIVARAGWWKGEPRSRTFPTGAGYHGTSMPAIREVNFLGKQVRFVDTTHERAHLFSALGLSTVESDRPVQAAIVEGDIGAIYKVGAGGQVAKLKDFLQQPGSRYIFAYALADPSIADNAESALLIENAGKTMALAGFAHPGVCPTDAERDLVEFIVNTPDIYTARKHNFRSHYLYNIGVETEAFCRIARLLTNQIGHRILRALLDTCDIGEPLVIGGGCALNCEWNTQIRDAWKATAFVPPCPNDSGIAIGAAVDASVLTGGPARLRWRVDCASDFDSDTEPPARWRSVPADAASIARYLASNLVLGWVQGRCEIGPRALGFRSLLASPYDASMRDRLNAIKQRERYRPVAPACPSGVAHELFELGTASPFMLHFARVRNSRLRAVTHVDGTARVQTVTFASNGAFWNLLHAFGTLTGDPVLCNTSLNFKGAGFINSMTELIAFADDRELDGFVVGERAWIRNQL